MRDEYIRTIGHKFGPAHQVIKAETYLPKNVANGEVCIEMKCAPINPSDIVTISGAYSTRTTLPIVPGFEGVGIISEIAPDVTHLKPGDVVMPIKKSGTWQEIQIVQADNCFKVDPTLEIEHAATSYINPMTAIKMVEDCARVTSDMSVIVNAPNSEIGHIIINLCIALGANTTAIVRNIHSEKALHTEFGTKLNIMHEAQLLDSKKNVQFDVLFDAVGGQKAELAADLIKHSGKIVHYGLLSGIAISPKLAIKRPDIKLELYWLRNWIHGANRQEIEIMFERTGKMFKQGFIKPRIQETFHFKDITKALNAHMDPNRSGKILLVP
tara:strand:- start:1072 stop:2049 length:978 start_codon:yes stop_codon:yes gene_type:complete